MISSYEKNCPTCMAVTLGDPAGIGPEIILKAYLKRREENLPVFIIYGCTKTLQERALLLGFKCSIQEVASAHEARALFSDALPVLPFPVSKKVKPGEPDAVNAKATLEAIKEATFATIRADVGAIVTNPISKATLYKSGFKYPGHTEYLAHLAETFINHSKFHPVMMVVSKSLRVVPVTIHMPIREIPEKLSQPLIETTILSTWKCLKEDFTIPNPRIAVAGLNPHAGESGTMGLEEIEIIEPVIKKLRITGINVTGPFSGDTLFHKTARNSFDAAVCMYHDQALIPLKTLDFDTGVNLTLGLPFVRTSPDHGTAFDIAKFGTASPNSLISSIKLAAEISERRRKMKSPNG